MTALEARALARLPQVLKALLSPTGYPSGDARAFNPQAKRRRWRFVIDPFSGSWVERSYQKHAEQRGEGLVAIVQLVTATQADRSAEILATVLGRLDAEAAAAAADAEPMTAPQVCREYRDIRKALDRRRKSLRMTFEELDHVSGVHQGYSAKLIGGIRHLGEMSMPSLFGALRLRLIVEPIEHKE